MKTIRVTLAITALLLAFAARAQESQPLHWSHEDGNTALAHDVSSETGNTRYHFDVPVEAFDLRVSLSNAGNSAGTSFVVRHGAPDGKIVCAGVQDGDAQRCSILRQLDPGRYYIEASTAPAHAELLAVTWLRMMDEVHLAPGQPPFQLAARPRSDSNEARHCLESRHSTAVEGTPIFEARCLPMGGPQQWTFEPTEGNAYRIRNVASGVCLSTENEGTALGTRVVEAACNGRASQAWFVYGSGGFRHYTWIANRAASRCLDFQGGEARLGNCTRDDGQMAAWTLRDDEQRAKSFPVTGGALQVLHGLRCASNDVRWVTLGTCGAQNARYVFASTFFFDTGKPGEFVIGEANNDDPRCVTTIDGPDGLHYATMAPCDGADDQRWTLVADGADWQFRNTRTNECLNAKGGGMEAGTRLITWSCTPSADNARWRFATF